MKRKIMQFLLFFSFLAWSGMVMASGGHTENHTHHNADAAIGTPGLTAEVDRTIPVEMNDDMRFVPESIVVNQGETIRFVLNNVGETDHEFVLGTEKELLAHSRMMQDAPEMEHEEPDMMRVPPGVTSELVWQFTKPGRVHFACLLPGHYEAGMKGVVSVEGASPAAHQDDSHRHAGHHL